GGTQLALWTTAVRARWVAGLARCHDCITTVRLARGAIGRAALAGRAGSSLEGWVADFARIDVGIAAARAAVAVPVAHFTEGTAALRPRRIARFARLEHAVTATRLRRLATADPAGLSYWTCGESGFRAGVALLPRTDDPVSTPRLARA